MAGSQPGESKGGSILPLHAPAEPLSDQDAAFLRTYDHAGIVDMMSNYLHCSIEEQLEAFRKNRESFRFSIPTDDEDDQDQEYHDEVDEDDDDEDDEADEVVEDEKREDEEILKLTVDYNKLASDGQHNEGERERKKPRLAEGFEVESFKKPIPKEEGEEDEDRTTDHHNTSI